MNKKMVKNVFAGFLIAALAVTSFGCEKKNSAEKKVGSGEMPETLTVFAPISATAAKTGAKDKNAILMYQIAEEKTGCHIEWICPTQSTAAEQFNLMIASREYPDLIQTGWRNIAGGAKQYVEDGVIVQLSDYAEYMPNYSKLLKEKPDRAAEFTNSDGTYEYAPCIRYDDELLVYCGPTIRKDWLDKLGLSMPANTDELYTVLKAFKEKDPNGNGKADEIPFSGYLGDNAAFGIGNIVSAFDVFYDFYVKDGKIVHGMTQPEMKEALTYLRKLYKEGLIDLDYLTHDLDTYDSKIMNNRTGFYYGVQPSKYYASMNDGTRSLVAVPYFEGKCHNPIYMMGIAGGETAITTECDNPAGAAKWLDFFYSEDGVIASNYGVEGKSFNLENENKILDMEYFDKNSSGLSRSEMFATTLNVTSTDFAGIQLWDSYSQQLTPWGKSAIEVWSSSASLDAIKPNCSLTSEEQDKVNAKLTDVLTYSSSLFNDIIIGNKDISELGKAEKELNKLGLQEILTVYNTAYKRYSKNIGE